MEQELIRSIVEEYFGIDLNKKSRKILYVEARAIYYKLCRTHLSYLSLDRIGRLVDRDHAVTINGIKRLEGWLTYDRRIQKIYSELNEKVLEHIHVSRGYVSNQAIEESYKIKYEILLNDCQELARKILFLTSRLRKHEPERCKSYELELKEEGYVSQAQ